MSALSVQNETKNMDLSDIKLFIYTLYRFVSHMGNYLD